MMSCHGYKRKLAILEGDGAQWSRTEGGDRGRSPVTSRATLSTDLGQRVAWFIYMQATVFSVCVAAAVVC